MLKICRRPRLLAHFSSSARWLKVEDGSARGSAIDMDMFSCSYTQDVLRMYSTVQYHDLEKNYGCCYHPEGCATRKKEI